MVGTGRSEGGIAEEGTVKNCAGFEGSCGEVEVVEPKVDGLELVRKRLDGKGGLDEEGDCGASLAPRNSLEGKGRGELDLECGTDWESLETWWRSELPDEEFDEALEDVESEDSKGAGITGAVIAYLDRR